MAWFNNELLNLLKRKVYQSKRLYQSKQNEWCPRGDQKSLTDSTADGKAESFGCSLFSMTCLMIINDSLVLKFSEHIVVLVSRKLKGNS